jgi:hypothetical protein
MPYEQSSSSFYQSSYGESELGGGGSRDEYYWHFRRESLKICTHTVSSFTDWWVFLGEYGASIGASLGGEHNKVIQDMNRHLQQVIELELVTQTKVVAELLVVVNITHHRLPIVELELELVLKPAMAVTLKPVSISKVLQVHPQSMVLAILLPILNNNHQQLMQPILKVSINK